MFRRVETRHAECMDTTRTPLDRTLVVMLSVIAALVIMALVVVFTRGEPEPLDPSSPAGVVQAYATLVIEGDELAAAEYLTAQALDDCVDSGYAATADMRLRLVSVDERDDSADVRVTIVESYSDGIGGGEYESEATFDLVAVDGEWRISSAPWQLMVCPNMEVGS
jgi:hypothetical protein